MFNNLLRVIDEQMNRPVVASILLAVLCLAGYANSLTNEFMLDDHFVLFSESGVSNKSFIGLFKDYQHIFYRPVGHIFLYLSYHLFKSNVVLYHSASLLLFIIIVVLFYRIVLTMFHDRRLALLTAALFGVHPINGMLVNYVTATVISTFVITMQLSFLFFLYHMDTQKKSWLVASLICFVLSLLSHEMSLMLPFYALSYIYFLRRDKWQKGVVPCVLLFAVMAGYFIFRLNFFSLKGHISVVSQIIPVYQVYFTVLLRMVFWYLSKLLIPLNILFLWTEPVAKSLLPFATLQFAGIVCVLFYVIFGRLKSGLPAFALAVFVLGLAPCLIAPFAHFPFADPIIEPHWFYFSSLGFFLLTAFLLIKLSECLPKNAWRALVFVLLACLTFLLWSNNSKWKDQETYSRYWLSLNKTNLTPYYGLGKALAEKGQYKKALEYYLQGLNVAQYKSAFIMVDIGYAYAQIGEKEEALKYFQEALNENPNYSLTYYYLGLFYSEAGDQQTARQYLQKAGELYPKGPKSLPSSRENY